MIEGIAERFEGMKKSLPDQADSVIATLVLAEAITYLAEKSDNSDVAEVLREAMSGGKLQIEADVTAQTRGMLSVDGELAALGHPSPMRRPRRERPNDERLEARR